MLDNPSLIILVLENLGCHHIKHIPRKRITCALPDGDNASSCQVILSEELNTLIHTRGNYSGGDIINLIMYFDNCDFNTAYKKCCSIVGMNCNYKVITHKVNETYALLTKFFKRGNVNEKEPDENTILPNTAMDSFINIPHMNFIKDGISIETQKKFNVSYDIHDNRIVFPMHDDCGNLVGIKGRTLFVDYKEKDIPKFLSYYPYAGRLNLYGLYHNYWSIISKEEVIVVEAEKAVQQADTMEVDNVVALSKKKISEEQFRKLLVLNVDIVFALDNDVDIENIKVMALRFKCITNIYVIQDSFGLLPEKSSPFDCGYEVWEVLYENKIKIM